MSEVKRYYLAMHDDVAYMKPDSEGYYVKFEDYEKLKAQLERAENVLEWFNKRYTGEEGIYAREYFKEKESK